MAKKKKNSKKEPQGNYLAQALDVALTVAVAAGLVYCGYRVIGGGVKIDQGPSTISDNTGVTDETVETEPSFQSVEAANADVHNGPLVLVNNYNAFEGTESDLVSLYEVKMNRESHSFSVSDSELKVKPEMADALISMLDDFYEATYDDNILVISGYRTKEKQQELYDMYETAENDEESEEGEGEEKQQRAAKAGYSEHQTGYGVDFELYDGTDYDGTGVYSWIDEHCAEYGLILRYPDGKTDITEIMFEPWHYRYVGEPHATYIMQNKICLEEYIDLLKGYTFEGEHLLLKDAKGNSYEIYYYPADAGQSNTLVPLPADAAEYTILGNNVDGFIVTLSVGATAGGDAEPAESDAEPAEETEAEESEEETSGEEEEATEAEEA